MIRPLRREKVGGGRFSGKAQEGKCAGSIEEVTRLCVCVFTVCLRDILLFSLFSAANICVSLVAVMRCDACHAM